MTISRLHTFVAGEVPTAAEWNADIDQLIATLNGGLDSSYITLSGATGLCDLSSAQTLSGRKTFTGGVVINEILSVAAAAAGLVKLGEFRYDPASGTSTDNDGFYISMNGDDDAATPNETEYARFGVRFTDTGDASEDGELFWGVMTAGTLATELWLSGAALYPNANDGLALGTTSLGFADLHLATGGVINWANGEVTLTETDANTLTVAGMTALALGASTITSGAHLANSNDVGALGASGTAWSDLFLASGAVIDFNAGDVVLTHSLNTLTLSGGNLALGANSLTAGSILANSNDVGALGASGTAWSDLFLASGAVVNFNAGDVTITHASNVLDFAGASTRYSFDATVLIGTTTANANVTLGMTLNQGAADDSIQSWKSSDVAHGMTTLEETDTYGSIKKSVATTGGVILNGYSEDINGAGVYGYYTNDNTTHTAAGDGAVTIWGAKKSGTTYGAMGANANILVVGSLASGARFIVDQEGDLFADGAAAGSGGAPLTTYDGYDDVALVSSFDHHQSQISGQKLIESEWEDYTRYNEQTLIDLNILGGPRVGVDPKERGLINYTGLARLHNGAIRQLGRAIKQQQLLIEDMRGQLTQIAGRN